MGVTGFLRQKFPLQKWTVSVYCPRQGSVLQILTAGTVEKRTSTWHAEPKNQDLTNNMSLAVGVWVEPGTGPEYFCSLHTAEAFCEVLTGFSHERALCAIIDLRSLISDV